MKRLFLIPLLAFALHAQPVPTANVTGTARVGTVTSDSYAKTFEWHMESLNAEFSVGDSTGTVVEAAVITNTVAYDGTYSLFVPTASDRITFVVSADDLVDDVQGTVEFWARLATTNNSASLWYAYGSASDYIQVRVMTGGRLVLIHSSASGAGPNYCYSATTNTWPANQWFRVTGKWQKDVTPYLSIGINGVTTTFSSTNLTPHATAVTNLFWGDRNGVAPDGYLDNARIWRAWK